jgi:hypothetical protein
VWLPCRPLLRELILPSTYVVLTEQTIVGGLLIGVEQLITERNAEFVLNLNASTSDVTQITFGNHATNQFRPVQGTTDIDK